MDTTTLTLAVDSTQVNGAAAALGKMADAGNAAAATGGKVTSSALAQGKALGTGAAAATKGKVAFTDLAAAAEKLGPNAVKQLTAALGATAAEAGKATTAVNALNRAAAAAPAAPAVAPAKAVASGTAASTLAAAAKQAAALRAGTAGVNEVARLTTPQIQGLTHSVRAFIDQVVAGQSPFRAFALEGAKLSGTFGSGSGAFKALMGLFTPARLALGGFAAAVGAVALAYYEGAKQSKAFADAVTLSGNYAGQTEGKLNALTRQIASHGQVTAGAAREAAQALLSTGEVGPQVFSAAVDAAALYAEATGKTADEVAKDFAQMARAPTKFAAEANRSLNFITAAQYEAIKSFEENGRAADAQGVIYDALVERLHKLSGNLGYLDKVLRNGKSIWSQFWDAAFDVGRTETIEDKIASIDKRIAVLGPKRDLPVAPGAIATKRADSERDDLQGQRTDLLRQQFRQGENAAAESFRAEANKAAIAADTVIDGYLKRGKAATTYKQKLDELNRGFKDKEAAGVPVSAADQKVALTQLKKDFTPAKGAGAGEAAQVLKAQLENDIKGIKDVFEQEKEAIAFQQRYVQGVYQAGQISLKDFYDNKRATIAEGVAAELAELDKETARLQQYLKATKDPSEKVVTQTKINEVGAQKEKISTAASREIILATQEETASFKALSDQVTNYRANLLQMQGDEAGAARLRAQTAIQNASILAKQAEKLGGPGVDVAGLARAISLTDQFNEVQRQSSILAANSARAEEAFALQAELSGKSQKEVEQGVYDLRVRELDQLGALAAKAKELADASTDPRIKAFAADLALQYAKAASAIDPALNRLRDATKELAAGLTQTIGNAPNAFASFYSQRRSQSEQDVKASKEEYAQRIDQLRGYLAQEKDARNKASLKKRIDQLQGESDGKKVESKGKTALTALNEAVIKPMAQEVFASVNKLLITDPLQKYLESQLKGLTEGDGALAGIFKDALGIKADPKEAALAQQTAAIGASTSALDLLTQAANAAAGAVGGRGSDQPIGEPGAVPDETVAAQSDAAATLAQFSNGAATAASDVSRLAAAAGAGGGALGRLPSIISLFQSAVASMGAGGGSGGGIGGIFGSLFGGSSAAEGMGYEEALAATGIFHAGGVVGSPPATRSVAASTFAGAARYHTGGIVGRVADKMALKHHEVPAILMGGPKGRREEVLHASDPRHRDNLGMNALAKIMAESKHEGMRVRGARELGGPVSANSMYRVNEKRPELLQVAGKQYLMTGSQGGTIDPNPGGGKRGGDTYNITVPVTPPAGSSTATASQWGQTAGRGIQRSLRRDG